MTIALSRTTGTNTKKNQGCTENCTVLVLNVTYVYKAARVLLAYPDLGLLRCAWVHWGGGRSRRLERLVPGRYVEVSLSQGSDAHYSIRDVKLLPEPVYKPLPFAIDLYNALSEAIYLLMIPAEVVIGADLMDLLVGSPPIRHPSGIFSLIIGRLLFAEGYGSTEVHCECGQKKVGGISRDELRPACTCTMPVVFPEKAVLSYFGSISKKSPPQDPTKLLAQLDLATGLELDRLVAGFVEKATGHTLIHFALS